MRYGSLSTGSLLWRGGTQSFELVQLTVSGAHSSDAEYRRVKNLPSAVFLNVLVMGISTSRFRQDAEFLLQQTTSERLASLLSKQAHRIVDTNYNILVRLAEEGHSEAIQCVCQLSRYVNLSSTVESFSRVSPGLAGRKALVNFNYRYIRPCVDALSADVDALLSPNALASTNYAQAQTHYALYTRLTFSKIKAMTKCGQIFCA